MKHAYLIMAHNEFDILRKLIQTIDDARNDIYIHIDKKVKDFDFEGFSKIPRKSRLVFTERISVTWGGYSQVRCEYILFKAAAEGHYGYYHLLSGVDFPLKTQDDIHAFFDRHQGKQFVPIHSMEGISDGIYNRVRYYYWFWELARSAPGAAKKLFRAAERVSLGVQTLLKVDRAKNAGLKIQKGANWISVTDEFLWYILDHEEQMKRLLRSTSCGDELLVQTLLYNSGFYQDLYLDGSGDTEYNVRYIDWERGEPYVFREEDYDLLINSGRLWARKFSRKESGALIDRLFAYVTEGGNGDQAPQGREE